MINLYHYEIIIIKLSRQIFVCMMSASLIIEHGLDEGQLNHLPESSWNKKGLLFLGEILNKHFSIITELNLMIYR